MNDCIRPAMCITDDTYEQFESSRYLEHARAPTLICIRSITRSWFRPDFQTRIVPNTVWCRDTRPRKFCAPVSQGRVCECNDSSALKMFLFTTGQTSLKIRARAATRTNKKFSRSRSCSRTAPALLLKVLPQFRFHAISCGIEHIYPLLYMRP